MDKKILMIGGDGEAVQRLQEFLLPRGGGRVEKRVVATGVEGIAVCREWGPDCILADAKLADMRGVDLVMQLSGEDGALPCAAVMFVHAGDEEEGFEAIKAGALDCVVLERVTTQGLNRAIDRAIEKFGLEKSLRSHQEELEGMNEELRKIRDDLEKQVGRRTEDLQASQDRYVALVSNVPGAIYSCNFAAERELHFLSPFIEQITGYPMREFVGEGARKKLEDIIHGDDRAEMKERLKRQLESQGHFALEYRVVHRNGAVLWVLDKGQQILGENGQAVSLEGIIFDITERRHLEEERLKTSKLESIGLLAGGVAHDLNNILTAISANVQLGLIEHERGQNVELRLQNANNACNSAADLAKQLLTFAKGGAPVRKPVDIGELIKKTVSFSLHGSKVVPEFQIEENLYMAEIDENQIGQVINNLVINADQATPKGGRLVISLSNNQQKPSDKLNLTPGFYVKISVQDEGEGIPSEFLSKIFDPYFTTKKHGSGLGLATSYSIIKRHKGLITVQSELGKGTRFDIYLPALPDAQHVENKVQESQPKGGHRVLFMDDNELIRMAVSNLLGTMGYHVTLASHGEEALAVYRKNWDEKTPYDFVMLDLTIPGGMGGREAIKQLRQINPAVVAIVVSGYSDDALMSDCKAHGFRAALTKPFTLQAVKEVLSKIESELETIK